MKNLNKQTGSTHVVIIIILVVAVIGLLGFVLWQNFIQKKDTTETNSTTTTQAATPATTDPATKSTISSLVIGTYDVEVPYDTTTDTYTLTNATNGYVGGYTVYSKKVTEACGSVVNVGSIKRFNKDDSIPGPSNNITLGNYVYALGVGGYGDCSAAPTVLDNAVAAFSDAFNNLKASD